MATLDALGTQTIVTKHGGVTLRVFESVDRLAKIKLIIRVGNAADIHGSIKCILKDSTGTKIEKINVDADGLSASLVTLTPAATTAALAGNSTTKIEYDLAPGDYTVECKESGSMGSANFWSALAINPDNSGQNAHVMTMEGSGQGLNTYKLTINA